MSHSVAFVWPEHLPGVKNKDREVLCHLYVRLLSRLVAAPVPVYLVHQKDNPPTEAWTQRLPPALRDSRFGIAVPELNDLWIQDWGPIWIREGARSRYVNTRYEPSYLEPSKAKPDNNAGTFLASLLRSKCKDASMSGARRIYLDGGNFVHNGAGFGIVSQRAIVDAFDGKEDITIGAQRRRALQLQEDLELKRLVVVPVQPGDMTGHVDGMVRFIDERTLAVARYARPNGKEEEYEELLQAAEFCEWLCLHLETQLEGTRDSPGISGLEIVRVPHDFADEEEPSYSATGIRTNFLQVGNYILQPGFGGKNDGVLGQALKKRGLPVEVFDDALLPHLSRHGGVLNCISWHFDSDDLKMPSV